MLQKFGNVSLAKTREEHDFMKDFIGAHIEGNLQAHLFLISRCEDQYVQRETLCTSLKFVSLSINLLYVKDLVNPHID